MTRSAFLMRIGAILVAAALTALCLRLALGPRWFGFYGVASVTLIALPFIAATLTARFRFLGQSRWPVYLLVVPLGLAALIQAVYWWAFFNLGPFGVPLGIGRTLGVELLETGVPLVLLVCFALAVWLAARGLTGDRTRP
ncbi:MAG: hypothetical protein NW217_07355 [Hyphomicrobiaceae bacterium]|nr:hypothetical protein [Hyphomicrobiaceae bacterium]